MSLDIFPPTFIISLFSFSVLFFLWICFPLLPSKACSIFFLIKQIHILLPGLLPRHSLKISHYSVLATEVGKVHWVRLAQSALWHCFQAGAESSSFWHRWCNCCSLFLNAVRLGLWWFNKYFYFYFILSFWGRTWIYNEVRMVYGFVPHGSHWHCFPLYVGPASSYHCTCFLTCKMGWDISIIQCFDLFSASEPLDSSF